MVESLNYFPYQAHHYQYQQLTKEVLRMAQQTVPPQQTPPQTQGQKNSPNPKEEPKKQSVEKVKADQGTENLIAPHSATHFENFDSQLGEWSTKIEDYKERISKFSEELKSEATEKIEELEAKYKETVQRMNELKTKGSQAKDEMKTGFEKAWKELSMAIENVKNSFH